MNNHRLSELRYKGHITDSEYKELKLAIKALKENKPMPVELKYIKGGMELSLIKSNKPSLKTVELANVIADVLSDQNITIDRLKETLNLLSFIDEDSGTVVKYLRVD